MGKLTKEEAYAIVSSTIAAIVEGLMDEAKDYEMGKLPECAPQEAFRKFAFELEAYFEARVDQGDFR